MTKSDLPLTPEQRIKELERQLDDANQKAQFFEAVVDVLQKDYGCRVVKSGPASPRAKADPGPERYSGLPISRFLPSGVLPAL